MIVDAPPPNPAQASNSNLWASLSTQAEIYLGRQNASNSHVVTHEAILRPGPLEATTTPVASRVAGRRVYHHVLAVDPITLAQAWDAIGSMAIDDAIVVEAARVPPVREVPGDVYAWKGVRQAGGNPRRHTPPSLEVVSGFASRVDGALVSAPAERRLALQIKAVVARGGAIDWSKEDPWRWGSRGGFELVVTDVAAPRGGGIQLRGHCPQMPEWHALRHRGVKIRRPYMGTMEQAPDGRWVSFEGVKPYLDWLASEARKLAPSDEDVAAFEGM